MKFPLKFLFSIALFAFVALPANAADIYFKDVATLPDFLNTLSGYDTPVSFFANDSYINFSDAYFNYHISTAYLYRILSVSHSGGYFTQTSWEVVDKNKNLIHDDVDDIISIFEDVVDAYFEGASQYKFKRWTGKLSVYIDDNYDQTIGYLGLYTPNSEILVDVGRSLDDIQATVAHELFHAIENVYIKEGFWDVYRNDNFFEGMAVLMQRGVANSSKGYLRFLNDAPFLYPKFSMFGPTEMSDLANYGSFIWYNFLQRKYGVGIIEELLEAYAKVSAEETSAYRSFLAVSDVLKSRGTTIDEAYLEYVTWNYDKEKYGDGKFFKDVYVSRKHKVFPVDLEVIGFDEAPALFASNYVEFILGGSEENLEVEFGGNDYADLYITFLSVKNSGVDYDKTVGYLVERGDSMRFTVPSSGNDKVIMIVSVVDTDTAFLNTANAFGGMNYVYAYSARRVGLVKDFEESEVLENIDLSEYFSFDPNEEWTYYFKEDFGSVEKVGERKIGSKSCLKKISCVVYFSDGLEVSFEMFADKIYGFAVGGKDVPKVKFLASGPVSQLIDHKSFKILGFSTDDHSIVQLSMGCAPSFSDDLEFNGTKNDALIYDCETVFIDNNGGKGTYFSSAVYVKGIGLVKFYEGNKYDDRLVSSYKETLVKTNFVALDELAIEADKSALDALDLVEESFADLAVSHKNYDAIMYLKGSGIINGYLDGTFRPDNPVNRAELLKILVEGIGEDLSVDNFANCFSDVGTEWFAPYVCYAKEAGWVSGYADGTFRPAQTVNKVEALKMLLNANNIELPSNVSGFVFEDVSSIDWFAPFVFKAKELEILEETGAYFSPADRMTRAGISENLYRLIK